MNFSLSRGQIFLFHPGILILFLKILSKGPSPRQKTWPLSSLWGAASWRGFLPYPLPRHPCRPDRETLIQNVDNANALSGSPYLFLEFVPSEHLTANPVVSGLIPQIWQVRLTGFPTFRYHADILSEKKTVPPDRTASSFLLAPEMRISPKNKLDGWAALS